MGDHAVGMVLALCFQFCVQQIPLSQILLIQKNTASHLVSEACRSLPSFICWDDIVLPPYSSQLI